MLNYFRESEVGGFSVEVALDDLKVGRSCAEEVVGLLVREISETKDLTDLAGREQFLELQKWVS